MGNDRIIEWSDRLAVGHPAIDREHRHLVHLIGELALLHERSADAPRLQDVFGQMREYALYHFRTETALMQQSAIDATHVTAHLRAHAGFVDCLDRAAHLIEERPFEVVHNLLAFLVDWLMHHIIGVDAELARLLADRASAATAASSTDPAQAVRQQLAARMSGLHEGLAARSFDLLELNRELEREVQQRRVVEASLQRSEARFSTLYRFAPVALWELDCTQLRWPVAPRADDGERLALAHGIRVLDVNDAGLAQVGCASVDELQRMDLEALFEGQALGLLVQALKTLGQGQPAYEGELDLRRRDGELRRLAVKLFRAPSAGLEQDRIIAATQDVTDLRATQSRLLHVAMHDGLTDLPNRLLLFDRLHQAMSLSRRTGRRLAVAFIDLDHFKPVNDELGHAVGDLLLQQVARRLRHALRDSDTVARLGGDEFMALLHDVRDGHDALAVAHKLQTALRAPFELAAVPLTISASIGMALSPDHGQDEQVLTRRADQAMYAAKRDGGDGVVIWRDELAASAPVKR